MSLKVHSRVQDAGDDGLTGCLVHHNNQNVRLRPDGPESARQRTASRPVGRYGLCGIPQSGEVSIGGLAAPASD